MLVGHAVPVEYREDVGMEREGNDSHDMREDRNAYEKLSNFVQVVTIGTGKFGCVHLVKNTVNQQYCVMKVLNKIDTIKTKQLDHTKNEREVLTIVKNQPFFTQLYATYSDHSNLYFCMEFCPGGELFKLLREVGRFNQKTTAFYAAEVLLAFEYLHERNIAYRDLKPENVLIAADGHLKLCDFGFAKHIQDRSWTLCGTPEYLPPEIILGKGHDKSVDWWSFGVFIFELLAGYAPFYGARPIDIYDKILEGIRAVVFPSFFSFESRDIIRRFLTSKTRRLGNTRGGVREIQTHPFFSTINWARLKQLDVSPPAVPNLNGEGDQTNFDIIEADAKFNLYSEEEDDGEEEVDVSMGEEPQSHAQMKPGFLKPLNNNHSKGNGQVQWDRKEYSTVFPPPPDLSVFDDWTTTVYI